MHLGIAAALVAIWLAGARPAPTPGPLDLKGAVKYALDHNAAILTRRANLASLESTFAKNHSAEYPPIALTLQNQLAKSSNAAGSLAQYGLTPSEAFSQNLVQVGTSSWTIYNGSYNQILAQQSKRQVEAARDDLTRAEQQLTQDVTNAYYTVTVRDENVRLSAADRGYQQSLLDVARNNERVGRIAEVDVLRAQVNELRAETTLATAEADAATARENLAQTIGAPSEQPFVFPERLPEPALPQKDLPALLAIALANRSDIASAFASVQAAELGYGLIDTDRYPVIAINGAFGNQFSPTAYGEELNTPGITNPPRGNPGFWQIGASETLNLTLIDYGSRHAAHRAANASIDAARNSLDTTKSSVENDVRQALRSAQTSYSNLATAKRASVLGKESARIAELQYKNGLIPLTDATSAEQSSLQAQYDLFNAGVTYVEQVVRLRIALGTSEPLAIVDMGNP